MEKLYYLDNAATTKVFDEVFDIMRQNNSECYYNPSASYDLARVAKKNLEDARVVISDLMHGRDGNFVFTSSATEANNMVFEGLHLRAGQEVLVSAGEHPAVYNAAHRLEKRGIIVKDIPLDITGKVDVLKFKTMLNKNVALVSIMHVSNETGAINDIKTLCVMAKAENNKLIFHSDGVQAFGKIAVNLSNLNVDMYSVSAHKIYAPRGIAGLWIKKGVVIDPLLVGGGQENNLRSSTENVAGAIAFAFSAKKVAKDLQTNFEKVKKYKDEFLDKLQNSTIAKFIKINSNDDNVPHIISVSFKGIKGEVLMNALQMEGVLISTGSACSSKKAGNRTLEAMGVSLKDITGSVRISFSPYADYDLDYIAEKFIKNVERFESNNITQKR